MKKMSFMVAACLCSAPLYCYAEPAMVNTEVQHEKAEIRRIQGEVVSFIASDPAAQKAGSIVVREKDAKELTLAVAPTAVIHDAMHRKMMNETLKKGDKVSINCASVNGADEAVVIMVEK